MNFNKPNIKEEQFIIEWSFEFMELLDGVRDETNCNYNNIDGLIEFGGYIVWFSMERNISFESYINLLNTLATLTTNNTTLNFDKVLKAILKESSEFRRD